MFLYMETPRMPMHLGGVYIFEQPPGKSFDFEGFKKMLRQRLHLSRIFRERLIELPLNLGHPYWVEDPDFDLEYHLTRIGLPGDGSMAELMELAATIFSRPLDRSHPLWQMLIVEGLNAPEVAPPGSFAMIYKVHHCAIDGASGAEIMSALLDFSPNPRQVNAPEKAWKPERIPTSMELIARSYGARLGSPLKIFNYLRNNLGGMVDTAAEVLKNKLQPPPFPFTAPHTPFNTEVSYHRIFRTTGMELKRIKAIKNAAGTTVNDTMLAICAGGLRKYLLEKEALPEKPLIAMAPISVRSKDEKGRMGNKVSAMLVDLATNEADPLLRLQLIHDHASAAKQVSKGLAPENLLDFVPAELAALSAQLYTRMHIPDRTKPVFNLVITNVPGPPMPLYMAGAKLLHHFAMAPLLDGLGLLLVIFSYAGKISLGAISCREIMPDLDQLMDYVQEALDELEASVISNKEEI